MSDRDRDWRLSPCAVSSVERCHYGATTAPLLELTTTLEHSKIILQALILTIDATSRVGSSLWIRALQFFHVANHNPQLAYKVPVSTKTTLELSRSLGPQNLVSYLLGQSESVKSTFSKLPTSRMVSENTARWALAFLKDAPSSRDPRKEACCTLDAEKSAWTRLALTNWLPCKLQFLNIVFFATTPVKSFPEKSRPDRSCPERSWLLKSAAKATCGRNSSAAASIVQDTAVSTGLVDSLQRSMSCRLGAAGSAVLVRRVCCDCVVHGAAGPGDEKQRAGTTTALTRINTTKLKIFLRTIFFARRSLFQQR